MAPRARFELATDRLTVDCSTTELPRNTCEVALPNQQGPLSKRMTELASEKMKNYSLRLIC